MKDRWLEFCKSSKLDLEKGLLVYENVIFPNLTKKTRYYHNIKHVYHCLNMLDLTCHFNNNDLVAAIWFHDLIYDINDLKKSVSRSAFYAKVFLDFMGYSSSDRVVDLIMVTLDHNPKNDYFSMLMCDIDFSILGCKSDFDSKAYKDYEYNLFREYVLNCYFNDDRKKLAYFIGRRDFLMDILNKERIFYTDFFYEFCEDIAIKNINGRISELNIEIVTS